MAHINPPDGLPGIAGLLTAYPETAKHLRGLAEEMLRGSSSLTLAEREFNRDLRVGTERLHVLHVLSCGNSQASVRTRSRSGGPNDLWFSTVGSERQDEGVVGNRRQGAAGWPTCYRR